ncbi:MAG: metallophosphoesterase family protein [Asticcacaulis sp.]
MLRKWISSLTGGRPQESEAATVIDMPTYAIGDIHGRYDLFEKMLAALWADSQSQGQPCRLVLLGDYVDRGPASAQVIERIDGLLKSPEVRAVWSEIVVLRGNHEATLLEFLRDSACGPVWMEYGGLATLASYNVRPPATRNDTEGWESARETFNAAFPESHRRLLEASQLCYIAGDYVFVHAGVRPGEPLELQGEETLLWIRGEFLESRRACEKVVVHGHTPEEQAALLPWRIGLDTGAYATGRLSAVRLKGTERQLIQVGPN